MCPTIKGDLDQVASDESAIISVTLRAEGWNHDCASFRLDVDARPCPAKILEDGGVGSPVAPCPAEEGEVTLAIDAAGAGASFAESALRIGVELGALRPASVDGLAGRGCV